MKTIFNIKCSQPQESPAGHFLAFLYYRTGVMKLFSVKERSGFPHDGGYHSLIFHIDTNFGLDDVEAFLSMIKEQYSERYGCAEFVQSVRYRCLAFHRSGYLSGTAIVA